MDDERARLWSRQFELLVATVTFMERLDGTILIPAAPHIAADFDVGSAEVGRDEHVPRRRGHLHPFGGRLADRFGHRRVFHAPIIVFTLASVLCAVSGSLPALMAGRSLQGLGGATMVPVEQLTVLRATDKRDLRRAIARITLRLERQLDWSRTCLR